MPMASSGVSAERRPRMSLNPALCGSGRKVTIPSVRLVVAAAGAGLGPDCRPALCHGRPTCSGSGSLLLHGIVYIVNQRQIICEWRCSPQRLVGCRLQTHGDSKPTLGSHPSSKMQVLPSAPFPPS